MKLATLILSFISFSLASPAIIGRGPTLTQRDGASIASALAAVDAQVNALNAAIVASPPVPSAIISGADAVNAAIAAGITVVKQSAALSDMDALNLISPTQTLSADTNKTITNLIAVKSQIDALGYGCLTLQKLQSQFAAAQEFSADIVALVPAGLQSTAQGLSAGIAGAIQNGINAYSGESCNTSTTSTASQTTSSSSATSTSAAMSTTSTTSTMSTTSTTSTTSVTSTVSTTSTVSSTTTQPPSASSTQPSSTTSTSSVTQSRSTTNTSTLPSRTTCSSATATATATATLTVTQVGPTITATVTKTVVASAPPKTTCHQTTVTSIKTVTKTTTRIEPWWCDDWW